MASGGGGRQTAIALVLAIVASELVLSGHGQSVWKAAWGPVRGLGQEDGGGAPGKTDINGNPPGWSNPGDNPYVGGL